MGFSYRYDGFKSVKATDRIPDPVEVIDVQISERGSERQFNIQVRDHGGTDNYYELLITNPDIRAEEFIVRSPELEEQMRSFLIQDPLQPDVQQPKVNRAFIKDAPFDGEEFTISLAQIQPLEDFGTQSVYIRTISKSYYDYFRSQVIQEHTNNQAFSEPVIIKSNVTNGHGIFAGSHLHVHGDVTYQSIIDRLVGTYYAGFYTYHIKDRSVNNSDNFEYLILGASVDLTINNDYSTTGEIRLPLSLDPDNPSDEVEVLSLDGGYTILRNHTFYGPYVLNLYHSTDTVLRDIQFNFRKLSSLTSNVTYVLNSYTDWNVNEIQRDARFNGVHMVLVKIDN